LVTIDGVLSPSPLFCNANRAFQVSPQQRILVLGVWPSLALAHWIVTIRKLDEMSTVKREPYGVFTSPKECNEARAKKILELDDLNYRQPHLVPDAPVITTTITVGATSTTTQKPGGPTETMNVTDCAAAAEKISADSHMAQTN
jgi:hypothetical protein